MLRILMFDEPFTLTLRVEGVLDRSSVVEYQRAIAAANEQLGGRKLVADHCNLKITDDAAESAILQQRSAGLLFIAGNGQIDELLGQQETRECQDRCSMLRRIAFVLTNSCRSSNRPFCLKLYRLLHTVP